MFEFARKIINISLSMFYNNLSSLCIDIFCRTCLITIYDFTFFLMPYYDHRLVYFRLPRHHLIPTIQHVLNQSKIMKISGKGQNIGSKELEY